MSTPHMLCTQHSISVVVNTMGRLQTLKHCIAALRRLDGPEFDLTIVVGPNSADTLRHLAEHGADLNVVECPLANLAISRNLGWRHAAGELIAFIDDDAVPLPGWLARLAEVFIVPKVGVAGGFVLDHTGARFQWQYLTIDPLCNPVGLTAAEYHGPPISDGPLDAAIPRFSYPAGTNMMFRRTALEQVDGFDEVHAYAADDAEVCVRLYGKGWQVAHVPGAQVLHRYAPSHQRTEDRIPRTLTDTVRSFVHFKLRHGCEYYDTVTVLRSVRDYLAGMHGWVDALQAQGQVAAADGIRLRAEIQEGARDGLRRALIRPQAAMTGGVALSRASRTLVRLAPADGCLRLCFISRELPPAPSGGIGVWTWWLARQLAAMGHEVHLIAEAQGHATMDLIEGCWVHRSPTVTGGFRHRPDLSDLPPFIRDNAWRVYDTVAHLEAERPFDMVSAPIWEAQGIALLRGRRLPTAVSLHTPMRTVIRTSRTWVPDPIWMQDFGKPLMAAETELVKNSTLVLGNSKSIVVEVEKEYDINIPRHRLEIVPHGVPDVPTRSIAAIERPLCKLLFVGRFDGRKGIDLLLAALPVVMEGHPELVAELVGQNQIGGLDGRSFWDHFRGSHAAAAWMHRISAPGIVDDARLLEAYRSCDLFVAPSRFESFGLIYVEAMRFGKPIIALDIGAAREVIHNGENGLLVQGEDSTLLAAAISDLISDSSRRRAMGVRAREIYEQRFTVSLMAEGVVSAFRHAIRGRRPQSADPYPDWRPR